MRLSTLGRFAALAGALVLGTVLVPQSVTAQSLTTQASVVGPRIAPVGVTNVVETINLGLPPVPQNDDLRHNGTDVAMMVVGGAAMVVGAVVGGDGGGMIAVAGAVIGLVGLFRYLR